MKPKLGDMYIDSCNDLCYFVYNGSKWVKCFYNNINDDNFKKSNIYLDYILNSLMAYL